MIPTLAKIESCRTSGESWRADRAKILKFSRLMLLRFTLLLVGATVAGCANTEAPLLLSSEPQARIRVYRGTTALLYLGNICDGSNLPVIHIEHWGLPFMVRSKSIGMPLTDDMPFSYDEYAIPAERPVTVRMYWQALHANGTWMSCGPLHILFTPEAGEDYDTLMRFNGGMCQGIEVRQFVRDADGKMTTIPAPSSGLPFWRCGRATLRRN